MWFPGVTSQRHANNGSLMLVAQGLTDSRILKTGLSGRTAVSLNMFFMKSATLLRQSNLHRRG